MDRSAFHIGLEFWCGGRQWRCTDVGTRTVVAIRVDAVEIVRAANGVHTKVVLSRPEAEASGWLSGPPYGVAEVVFDEFDLGGCSLAPEAE